MAAETEKITLNLGPIDLGQINLLVQEGFYSNRTDFIRAAIRNHLANQRRFNNGRKGKCGDDRGDTPHA